ncbi:amino acid adenylation domain-containing protein [Sorangium sp. So ce1389]|uniref:amino acid adenylation domain-containing protein n=1 Tax=Sorangium sp. So ce1389 TaxID=3133336 RepID=UPI003F60E2CC
MQPDSAAIRGFRLSAQQRRGWIAARGEERWAQVVLAVEGVPSEDVVRQAIDDLVARHEILRTRFTLLDGMAAPLMVIGRPGEHRPRVVSAPPGGDGALSARLLRALEEEQVASAPLTTWAIAGAGEGRWLVAMRASTLCIDHASIGHLAVDLAGLVRARLQGSQVAGPEPIQYCDYAEWAYEMAASDEAAPGREHWARALAGAPSVVPGFGEASAAGRLARPWRLDAGPTRALQAFARDRGLSDEAVALAAWVALVARHVERPEVLLGVELRGREYEDLAGALGLYAQHLPLAARVEPDMRFEALAAEVQAQLRTAARWQECFPVEPGRGTSSAPPPVGFAFDEHGERGDRGDRGPSAGVSVHVLEQRWDEPPLAIGLRCGISGGELCGSLSLSGDLYGADFADLLQERLLAVLQSVARDPAQAVSRIEVVGPVERARIVGALVGAAEAELPPAAPGDRAWRHAEASVVDTIEAVAVATPERTAVRCGAATLTYGELHRRALRLAAALAARGVGPGARIPLVFDRSVDLVVGILGVLLAGAAYVPIDPAYPEERKRYVLARAAAPLAVVHRATVGRVPVEDVLVTDALDGEPLASSPFRRPRPAPDDLAYVIYTSGSTGTPKGVEVTHRNLASSARARRDLFGARAERCLLLYSYAFDSSVAPIFNTLCDGGEIVVAEEGAQRDATAMASLIREHRIDVTYCNPNVWGALLDGVEPGTLPSQRIVIVAGEACTPSLVAKHFARLPSARLLNEYGPTEATVWCCGHECRPGDAQAPRVPIGSPATNAVLYVVDEALRLAPLGLPGELCVGGSGVARGYAHDPALTAARFLPDPFRRAGGRIYRTGDRVRLRAGGDLEFLGRIDDQLKIRGYRVEPAEIELALGSHPAVLEVAVAARDDGGGARLVGYIATRPGQSVTDDALRERVASSLPAYMVPSSFVRLASLPKNVNGKVDRSALPDPETTRGDQATHVAPRTATEEALARVWETVLRVEPIGIDDNFFALGGDSIRSIRVQAGAAKHGIQLTPRAFFDNPTIRELAAWVDEHRQAGQPAGEGTAHTAFELLSAADRAALPPGVVDAHPLTALQADMLFHSALAPRSAFFLDISSWHVRAPFERAALEAALRELSRRHPALRSSFDLTRYSEPLQLVAADAEIPLRVEDWRHLDPAAQEGALAELLERERAGQLDFGRAPLLRFSVHRRSDDTLQLTWAQHHAVLDGWSTGMMISELVQLYLGQLGVGVPALQPVPAVGQAACVAAERAARTSADSRAFFGELLRDLPPTRAPGASRPDRPLSDRVCTLQARFDDEEHAALVRLADGLGVPLKAVLRAALLRALSFLSGQDDLTIGAIVSCRPDSDGADRAVGMFLNTVPFRTRIPDGSWRDLVRGVFDTESRTFPHRRYPFAQIQKDLGGSPIYDTVFNFTNFHVYESIPKVAGFELLDVRGIGETNLSLTATFSASGGQLNVVLNGNAARYEGGDLRRIARCLRDVFREMTRAPDAPHQLVDLLTEDERALLDATARGEARAWEGPALLDALVLEQAARTPEAVAVLAGDGATTYATLCARADAVAGALRRSGAGRESRVGICMDRSAEAVIAALGVLRAGAAFVPLDPEHPTERLASTVRDAALSVVLVDGRAKGRLAAAGVALLQPSECPAPDPSVVSRSDRSPDDAAYVIYTSGTTGRPNGVVVSHRAACNHLRWRQEAYPLRGGDRFLQKASPGFDISIWETFAPLIAGATLVLARTGGQRDSAYLARTIASQGITDVHFSPQLLDQILREPEARRWGAVRRVFCGGEALPRATMDSFFEAHPGVSLIHQYGPTEATIDAMSWDCRPGAEVVPLGRPIANTTCFVVDRALRRVPPGATGELCLGGASLARGYLGQPGLTAERFVPDPFSGAPASRMYRTGDLARLLPGGDIEFVGRRDRQVNLRGHRVELGEIEGELSRIEGVRSAVCALRDAGEAGARLVAYVVPGSDGATPASLREALGMRLPRHMLPSDIVLIASMPLTAQGKVDIAALPAPSPVSPRALVAARDPLEQQLVGLWEEVLGRAPIGVTDDFFELGGHSILAMRLVLRLEGAFGQAIPVSALFESPTVEGLARAMHGDRRRARQT